MHQIDVVVGGQYGSEGKGHVVHRLIRQAQDRYRYYPVSAGCIVNIRVAGPNAGHTVITDSGVALALRTIPVGVATENVRLYIAAGSEVDLDVLMSELQMVRDVGCSVTGRLWVDPEATVLDPDHIKAETGMHERLGSTGKGIGAARADRLMRRAARIKDLSSNMRRLLQSAGVQIGAPTLDNSHVIIEGTQGYGLGLHAGHYPQCTSSDCRAIDFLAMAGISPWAGGDLRPPLRVWVCVRPNPIRVAGNSGPLKGETTWADLGLPEEKTTVTKKVRRVGQWDGELVREAVRANGGPPVVRLAFTMADQVVPGLAGHDGLSAELLGNDRFNYWIHRIQNDSGARVGLVTTGPNSGIFL